MKQEALRAGVSCCGAQNLTDTDFENYKNGGINLMELSFSAERYSQIPWKDVQKRAEKYDMELWSFHLPFCPFEELNITSENKDIRDKAFRYHSELLKKAADIGIGVIVVHPSIEPYEESERKLRMEISKQYLSELAEVAECAGAVVAVENLPRTCLGRDSTDMLELLSADSRLRCCFDTNHLLSQPITEFIHAMGDKIITTHVSDFDFRNERHWLPGEGEINWKELILALRKVNYTGPLVYELELEPSATINRRILTYHDFKKNHEVLLNGGIPEAIGTPVAEKCVFWK